jgi:AcrR family transcriptional regulator
MTLTRQDRRVARSRAALVSAFSELLLERGYEGLTVAQVAERADVGRSTLYEHFRTKDDLLKGILADAVKPGAEARPLAALLEHLRANAAAARVLLTQPLRSRIARVLAQALALRMDAARAQADPRLLAIALAEGQLALIDAWLKAVPAIDLDDGAQALLALSNGFLFRP